MSSADHFGQQPGSYTSRRKVLAMMSALGVAGVLQGRSVGAQPRVTNQGIIDTHHHIYPPRYVQENLDHLRKDAAGFAERDVRKTEGLKQEYFPESFYRSWTPARSVEEMDKAGVATAITSITSPGVWYDDGRKGRDRARECNEFGAQMSRDFPGRFGMFAALPLPDTQGSLKELTYALDVLKLDGVGLLTSYAGRLLGDPAFRPVFEELHRRKAVVFVHPTLSCCGNLFPGAPNGAILEFTTDTARTITSLLLSGTLATLPGIQFIFSHGGGVLPSMVERLHEAAAAVLTPEQRSEWLPQGLDYELRRQHYDLASIAFNPAGMAAVLKLFPISQLTYGSDAPFHMPVELVKALAQHGLSPQDLRAIRRENALRLFPRFAA